MRRKVGRKKKEMEVVCMSAYVNVSVRTCVRVCVWACMCVWVLVRVCRDMYGCVCLWVGEKKAKINLRHTLFNVCVLVGVCVCLRKTDSVCEIF